MINKKNIITTAVILGLFTTSSYVKADDSNNLLKMDVKRASTSDAVDVTFYTTEGSYNSVVTRKSDNRYVVLLPNTASSSSIVPSLGGVKDLISDVNVKNVDDGIGGYTKVTFTTTKPVKIQTYTKKTAPLTKAQEDYKNLIAKHEATPVAQNTAKPAASSAPVVKSTASNTAAKTAKPVEKVSKPAETKKTVPANSTVAKQIPAKTTPAPKAVSSKPEKAVVPAAASVVVNKPKVNVPSENSENVLNSNEVNNKPTEQLKTENTNVSEEPIDTSKQNTVASSAKENNVSANNKSKVSKLFLIGLLSAIGLFLLGGLFNLISGIYGRKTRGYNGIADFGENSEDVNNSEEYEDIMNDESLNWQEKYKRYTETDKKLNHSEESGDLSYVTDIANEKTAIVTPISKEENNTEKSSSVIPFLAGDGKRFNANISQLEHSYVNTPNLIHADVKSNKLHSEDEKITSDMSKVKLKAFAKPKSLREASRAILSSHESLMVTNPAKEGNYVKLKNSPLSVSKRASANSISGMTDVIKSKNNKAVNMNSKSEKYSTTSLGEYLSKLDNDPLEKISNSFSSGVTNPVSHVNDIVKPDYTSMSGMKILSGYDIDSERGFYLIDEGSNTALISKNKNNISIIKRFNSKMYKQLQVRLDYGSVYIVRVGSYKCLVDSADEKMGALLEI